MHFVDKKTLEKKLYISFKNQEIIRNPNQFSHAEHEQLIHLLAQRKDTDWILCGCNAPQSLLIICSLRDKIYIRCKSKNSHLTSCHFHLKDTIEFSNTNSSNLLPTSRLLKYNLYNTSAELCSTHSTTENYNNHHRTKSRSTLGQALYTAFVDSKLNILQTSSEHRSLIDQLQKITATFNDPQKIIHKNIPLSKFYRYSLTSDTLHSSERVLVKASTWSPKGIRPFMLFTAVVTSITLDTFVTKKDDAVFTVKNTISLPSGWINREKSYPYLLITSALLDSNMQIFLNDAFAMPIYSTNLLIPLESNYERTILKIIFKATKNLKDLIIEKPLLCLRDGDGNKYRPDFIISSHNGKTIYIEVLGSRNELYLLHKTHISNISKQYCSYFLSVKAYDIQNVYSSFLYDLQQTLSRLL